MKKDKDVAPVAVAKCSEWLAIEQQIQFNCQLDARHEGNHEVSLVTPEIEAVLSWSRKEAAPAPATRKGPRKMDAPPPRGHPFAKPKAAKKASKSGSSRKR